ncbi:unnamed protein product [Cuscuta campestris]|uniref:Uncharacterized protein n=1 Tax=Cuscuta campestris TaxID=132261 RepID=A0A484KHB9_9ASTE|nr:unnamed protein product [Cuscuta campestris]
MLGVMKILIDTPPSPPNLVSTIIEKNVESLDQDSKVDSSIDSQVGDDEDSALEAIKKDDKESKVMEKDDSATVADVVNVYTLNPTSSEFFVPINVSVSVVIAKFNVLNIIDNVVDTDNKQVDNHISFDIIKLCAIADVVKMQHLVSLSKPTCSIGSISQAPQFTPSSNMVEDSRNGPLFWFSIISPVQKHEWEPPPLAQPTYEPIGTLGFDLEGIEFRHPRVADRRHPLSSPPSSKPTLSLPSNF